MSARGLQGRPLRRTSSLEAAGMSVLGITANRLTIHQHHAPTPAPPASVEAAQARQLHPPPRPRPQRKPVKPESHEGGAAGRVRSFRKMSATRSPASDSGSQVPVRRHATGARTLRGQPSRVCRAVATAGVPGSQTEASTHSAADHVAHGTVQGVGDARGDDSAEPVRRGASVARHGGASGNSGSDGTAAAAAGAGSGSRSRSASVPRGGRERRAASVPGSAAGSGARLGAGAGTGSRARVATGGATGAGGPQTRRALPASAPSGPVKRLRYAVLPGNNSRLLKVCFRHRKGWTPTTSDKPTEGYNFIWEQYKKASRFRKQRSVRNRRQLINHLEFNQCLVTKRGLFKSLRAFLLRHGQPDTLFRVVPATFYVRGGQEGAEAGVDGEPEPAPELGGYAGFVRHFRELQAGVDARKANHAAATTAGVSKAATDVHPRGSALEGHGEGRASAGASVGAGAGAGASTHAASAGAGVGASAGLGPGAAADADVGASAVREESDADGEDRASSSSEGGDARLAASARQCVKNIWIVKPAHLTNRGSGIEVASSIEEVHAIVMKKRRRKAATEWIVQKYLERPLLIHGRKFDLRCYVLVVSCDKGRGLRGYLYADGYIRTSVKKFALKSLKDRFIHLTNDAVQKKSAAYGKFEPGNKMSYREFAAYLEQHHNGTGARVFDTILPAVRRHVALSLQAVAARINKNHSRSCFELFGYDFMVDADMRTWLVEVNANPCLELSSPFLELLIPRMLEHLFQLTVDRCFPHNLPRRDDRRTPAQAVPASSEAAASPTAGASATAAAAAPPCPSGTAPGYATAAAACPVDASPAADAGSADDSTIGSADASTTAATGSADASTTAAAGSADATAAADAGAVRVHPGSAPVTCAEAAARARRAAPAQLQQAVQGVERYRAAQKLGPGRGDTGDLALVRGDADGGVDGALGAGLSPHNGWEPVLVYSERP